MVLGRVDERILFGYCDSRSIYKMFSNFYRDKCPTLNQVDVIDNTKNISPCDVENALRKFSKEPLKAIEMINENKGATLEQFTF